MTGLRLAPPGTVAVRFGRFGLVGLSGLAVNAAAMAAISGLGVPYLLAALLATQVSTTWNFIGAEWWAFGDRRSAGRSRRLIAFFAMNNATFLVRGPIIVADRVRAPRPRGLERDLARAHDRGAVHRRRHDHLAGERPTLDHGSVPVGEL